jgi:dTDP-4-dehydrorhamnose reductase
MLRLGKERSELSVVNDQIGSPTYAADLVEMILTIIDHESFRRMGQKTQIYHYSNAGKCSWYEFAKEIFSLKKIECRVSPITTDQYKTLARRPKRSLLDNKKIEKKFSIKLKHWKDSLSTCLNRV